MRKERWHAHVKPTVWLRDERSREGTVGLLNPRTSLDFNGASDGSERISWYRQMDDISFSESRGRYGNIPVDSLKLDGINPNPTKPYNQPEGQRNPTAYQPRRTLLIYVRPPSFTFTANFGSGSARVG